MRDYISKIDFKIPENVLKDKALLREFVLTSLEVRIEKGMRKWICFIILHFFTLITSIVLMLAADENMLTIIERLVMYYGFFMASQQLLHPSQSPNEMFLSGRDARRLAVLLYFIVFSAGFGVYINYLLGTSDPALYKYVIPGISVIFVAASFLFRTGADEEYVFISALHAITDNDLDNVCESIRENNQAEE